VTDSEGLTGTVRPITRWGSPVMHRPARPVTAWDDELHQLIADMWVTMYAADGVGLAACQIGVDLALFVYDCPDDSGERHTGVVCNPAVVVPEGRDRRLDDTDEGCLSFPGAYAPLARPDTATVTGDGLLARCLQHETDHTLGRVFGDRLPTRQRKKLTKAHDGAAANYPEGWPAA